MDFMEEAVDLVSSTRSTSLPTELANQVEVLQRAAELTAEAMPRLRTMSDLEEYWIEINRLENDGDKSYRRIVAKLFNGKYDALTVMKLKDVVDAARARDRRLRVRREHRRADRGQGVLSRMELALVIVGRGHRALAFDYTNGFHDAANAIATSISTRALTPRVALTMAAVMNFAGALLGQEVASTVSDVITPPSRIRTDSSSCSRAWSGRSPGT